MGNTQPSAQCDGKKFKDRWKKKMIENHMHSSKMGRATCQWTIGTLGHFYELGPNSLSKTSIRLELKNVS
jgi:hypothetical protein